MKYVLKIVTLVNGVSLVVVTASVLAAFCFMAPTVHADTQDWFIEGATVEPIDDPLRSTPRMLNHSQQCRIQEITIVIDDMPGNISSCIYQAKSFRFGLIQRYIDGRDRSTIAISVGSDQRFYLVSNLVSSWNHSFWHASSESDHIVFSDQKKVVVYKNIPESLDKDFGVEGTSYTLRNSENTYGLGNEGRTMSVAMSANGDWLLGYMEDYGMFRMRLSDGSVRLVARTNTSRGYHFNISNDGMTILDGGGISYADTDTATHAKIFSINADCGKESIYSSRIPMKPNAV